MEPSLKGFDLVANCELTWPPGKVTRGPPTPHTHLAASPARPLRAPAAADMLAGTIV